MSSFESVIDLKEYLAVPHQDALGGADETRRIALAGMYDHAPMTFLELDEARAEFRRNLLGFGGDLIVSYPNHHEVGAFWTSKQLVLEALTRVSEEYLDYNGDLIVISTVDGRCLQLELERSPHRFEVRSFVY